MMQFSAAHVPKNIQTHGPGSFGGFQFAGDADFAEPALGLRPLVSAELWELGLNGVSGPKYLDLEKKRAK